MTTISFYNHTRKLFANNEVTLANLKLMLVNNYTFDATETNMSGVASAEMVWGNGWDSEGEPIPSAAITVVNTNEAMLDATDISVTATGGNIGPASGAIIYETGGAGIPLFYIDFQGSETAGVGTPFNVNWNASGIARWLVP